VPAVGLVLTLAGCVNALRNEDRPPPTGTPWLARLYQVQVSLLGTDCAPGGLEAAALHALAEVRQDLDTVSWIQHAEDSAGGQWGLAGRLCADPDASAEDATWSLRLSGGRVARVRSTDDLICRVEMIAPAGARTGALPSCTDPAITFEMHACGVLRAELDVSVAFGDGCSRARTCTLRFAWEATPLEVDPRTPLDRRLICTE
jgi:hypothetical protein